MMPTCGEIYIYLLKTYHISDFTFIYIPISSGFDLLVFSFRIDCGLVSGETILCTTIEDNKNETKY